MTHDQFVNEVDRIRAAARRVGLWPAGVTITDAAAPKARFWRRRTIDQHRLVVYIRTRRRDPARVVADIRRAIVRLGGTHLSPDERITRAVTLRRLTDRDPSC